jgi:hypothetical protein
MLMPPLPRVDELGRGQIEEPEEIMTWRGSIFGVYSNAVADWQGSGYGALLETPTVRQQLQSRFRDHAEACSAEQSF